MVLKSKLKRKDFNFLKEKNNLQKQVVSSDFFTFKIFKDSFIPSRFSVIISSKVSKKAVVRNKLKRRIKEIFGNCADKIKDNFAIIIYPKKESLALDFKKVEKELIFVFRKSKILK